MYKFQSGDFVAFVPPGHIDVEIGRVASVRDETIFVCYEPGCIAAATRASSLLPIRNDYMLEGTRFGHHRFDDWCDDLQEDCCEPYCPDKFTH